MAITSIENLSNEIFYEIFEYLDGYRLYKAFSNLNHRFQQLFDSSSLLFKIHFHSTYNEILINDIKQLILLYKHKILSFDFYLPSKYNHFFSSFTIDSSFDHLESLTLIQLDPTIHSLLIFNLTSLPRLFSLKINAWYSYKDLNDVYQLMFALPKLKYAKCSAENDGVPTSLSIATDQQFSSIEHLVIDHSCTFKDLFGILSYTPQLVYLKFQHTKENDSTISMISSITLSNLTSISIDTHYMTFDELECLISNFDCELKVLRVITLSPDSDYFNADRWEELITEYLPQLEKLYFQYTKQLDPEYDSPIYSQDPNQFISSFWIEQEWLLEIEMDSFEVVYSIRPYKERWYDAICSAELCQSTRLTITYLPHGEDLVFLTMNIRDILTTAHIYHLEISHKKTDFSILMDIIHTLPKLQSLKIHSLSLLESRDLFSEEKMVGLIAKKNKIRKVCLEKMTEMKEVYYLMKLCPRMAYLQVDGINTIEVELVVQDILNKINKDCNEYLRLLCICVPTADDKMVEKLKEIINSKKLLVDYTIERLLDHIYLQWGND